MARKTKEAYRIGNYEAARGDIVRSMYGRTERLVVGLVAGEVIVLTPSGKVDAIPAEGLRKYWCKVGSVDLDELEDWNDVLPASGNREAFRRKC